MSVSDRDWPGTQKRAVCDVSRESECTIKAIMLTLLCNEDNMIVKRLEGSRVSPI